MYFNAFGQQGEEQGTVIFTRNRQFSFPSHVLIFFASFTRLAYFHPHTSNYKKINTLYVRITEWIICNYKNVLLKLPEGDEV